MGGNKDEGQEKAPLAGVLPEDILREILLRLPADALCRLRLVCQPWRSLTSDPGFAKAHAARHPLIAGLDRTRCAVHIVDMMSGRVLRRIPVPLGASQRHCTDLTTAQPGLVCVSPNRGPSFAFDPVDAVVTATPTRNAAGSGIECRSILGLVPSTGHHKVLRFQLESTNAGLLVQRCLVLTLNGDRRWRAGPRPPVIVDWHRSGDRVVVDGVAYFLRRLLNLRDSANVDPDSIASFDLATEKWRPTTMAGPASSILARSGDTTKLSQHKHRLQFQLAQLEGCLVTVHHYRDCSMNLWFLVDADKGIWDKKYSVQCETRCDMSHVCDPPHPLVILGDGRIVFRLKGGVIRAYDASTTMWADLANLQGYPVLGLHQGSLLCS
ncbi:hypothetical protein HU200_050167 [Digitaria exilis]|uniref:F-box domain-containing protein n=1 Tax=Digitaria exilis TaxID=1010633 RepID=A0A835AUR9_9POAL|nr:hypothetical protein HU200_050167 [Digitaria exilis]